MINKISPNTFKNANVLIIGDIILDHYIHGSVSRISPEAPVPVLLKEYSKKGLGGAGNVAANILALGGNATLITITGEDTNSKELENLLTEQKIRFHIIKDPSRRTTTKTRIMAKQHQLVRIDEEHHHELSEGIEEKILNEFDTLYKAFKTVILSDYGKGLCKKTICQNIIEKCTASNIEVIVDPKGRQWHKYTSATCITPNFAEFLSITGDIQNEDDAIIGVAPSLCRELNLDKLLVTRGSKGMVLVDKENAIISLPADAKEVFDVSGAGDTVIAGLAACRSMDWPWEKAVEFANMAAGIVVGKSGTQPISITDITERMAEADPIGQKVMPLEKALLKTNQWKAEGLKIGFTNGCFDILHTGHIHLLHSSAKRCDKLIVGLNSDASITGLKGPDRPILPQEERSTLIAAIKSVDMVIIFDEETPIKLIDAIKPMVLIKGKDYEKSQVVGADLVESWGGEVALVDLMEDKSTTSIIEKIKKIKIVGHD